MRRATALAAALLLAGGTTAYLLYLRELDELVAPPRPHGAAVKPAAPERAPPSARTPTEEHVTVVGRLVDTEGAPFADLRVVASAAGFALEVHSDARGAFELTGLPRVELVLDPGADFDPAEPLGVRRIAGQVAAVALDLRTGPARVDAGTLTLPRSRPFWVEGRVTLDEEWARPQGLWLGDVRLELAPPDPDDFLAPASGPETLRDGSRPPWCDALPAPPSLAEDGSFRFAVETPHDPFVLRARIQRFEPVERLLWPKPDGVQAEAFRLPAGR